MDKVSLLKQLFKELEQAYNGIIDLETDIKTALEHKEPDKLLDILAEREKTVRSTEELMGKINEAKSEIKKHLPANEYQTIISYLGQNEELLRRIIKVEEENLMNGQIVLEDMKLQLSRLRSVKKIRSTYGAITWIDEPRFIDQEK
ncbi:MAG: hypothetical protein ACYCVD_00320 [Desulfitobacteriaceae bacterium]